MNIALSADACGTSAVNFSPYLAPRNRTTHPTKEISTFISPCGLYRGRDVQGSQQRNDSQDADASCSRQHVPASYI